MYLIKIYQDNKVIITKLYPNKDENGYEEEKTQYTVIKEFAGPVWRISWS